MLELGRREFVITMCGASAFALFAPSDMVHGADNMYGLIGKMKTAEGKRDELIKILLDDTDKMPGCLSYIVAKDPTDANAIWITEVWDTKESHEASLKLPSVQAAIAKGRPMITGFGERFETEPVGGHGLQKLTR